MTVFYIRETEVNEIIYEVDADSVDEAIDAIELGLRLDIDVNKVLESCDGEVVCISEAEFELIRDEAEAIDDE